MDEHDTTNVEDVGSTPISPSDYAPVMELVRRATLKMWCPVMGVRVRSPPGVQN